MSSVYWLARWGIAITSATYVGWRSKRLATQQNMAKILELPADNLRVKRAALSSWSNYGRTAASLICLPYLDMSDVEARTQDLTNGMAWQECVQLAMAPGKGVVIATGHFGSWDLAGAITARHVPLSAVADSFKDPRLNRLLQGHRREKSVDIIPVSTAPRRVMQELVSRRAVAILADRPVTKDRGVEVTFFGHKTYVPVGAAALSVKSGAPIMPGYLWYAPDNRYYIRAFPPIFPRAVDDNLSRKREIQRLTQYVFACQEEVVRQNPAQWFMFRRFWPANAEVSGVEATQAIAA